jgi:hypothetical protein
MADEDSSIPLAAGVVIASDQSSPEQVCYSPADESGELALTIDATQPLDRAPDLRPLRSVLDEDSELVIPLTAPEVEPAPLDSLAELLCRPEPLTWLFAGVRLEGDAAFGDGRTPGEWFAEEWRSESGRLTDLVIDATWPEGTLAVLKSHLKSRVVRHRPDIAVLFLSRSEAAAGIEELAPFERRLVAILSVLSEIGTQAVIVHEPFDVGDERFENEIYDEAIRGVARERGVSRLILPAQTGPFLSEKTPNSAARSAALFLCREALRVRSDLV